MPFVESLLVVAGKSFLDTVAPKLKKKLETFLQKNDWHTAGGRYYDKIEKTYGWTRILGKPEPVRLEGIFTDVYLLDKITAWRRFEISSLQSDPEVIKDGQKRLSGVDLVKQGKLNRLYILGKPGAGKTTFLKYIALKASNNEIKKIPIFVSLKDWADSNTRLIDFLVKQFDICEFPESQPLIEYILDTGQAIVLFDGLDETNQEGGKRDQTIAEIRDFSRKYDKSQILITCRIAASDYTFEEFHYLEVADFSIEQVWRYLENWFGIESENRKQFEVEFTRPQNEPLREMANTPLLLSLLCLNFEETGTFPNRRVEIYEEGINALLHKWDSSRSVKRDEIYKGLSLGRKRQMFARIAAQTFEKNEYFISKRKLANLIVDYLAQLPDAPDKEDIEGEAILRSIEAQHSIFIERAKDIYSFSHLTFQEYFTAKYIVDNAVSGTLTKLLEAENLHKNRWREVILNTVSMLDNSDVFFINFQNSINQMVESDNNLDELLSWVETKTQTVKTIQPQERVRSFYLDLAQIVIMIQYPAPLYEPTLVETDRAKQSYPKISLTHSFEENLIFAISNYSEDYLESDYDLVFDLRLVRMYEMTHSFMKRWSISSTSKEIIEFNEFLEITKDESWRLSGTDCREAIKDLQAPTQKSNRNDWVLFFESLLDIMQSYRNLGHQWYFPLKLNQYLTANELLIDCLKLAVVSNRQTVESKLLLPLNHGKY